MKLKTTVGLMSLFFICQPAFSAIPYHGYQYDYKQPNGDVITLTLEGNDYYAEQRTPSGKLVIYDKQLGGLAYAKVSDDGTTLVSKGELVTQAKEQLEQNLRSSLHSTILSQHEQQAGLSAKAKEKLAEENRKKLLHVPQEANKITTSFVQSMASSSEVTGDVRGLTILIDFPDDHREIDPTEVDSFLNDLNYKGYGNFQSIRGYFRSVSGGKLDYTNTVTSYYRAKHNKSYYTNPNIEFGVRAQELIHEALEWLEYQQGFDFSTLTTDRYGRIKGLNIFYAGDSNSAWSTGLWPHMGGVNPQFCADGVCTNAAQMSDMGDRLSIGTFAHESGHLIAEWPDLYDYDGSSNGSVAQYGIMGYGATNPRSMYHPVPPVAPLRELAGWETVVELNPAVNPKAPTGRITATSGSNKSYKWTNPNNPAEAFYMEAIYQSGQNTEQLGSGLAIWHVDPKGNNSDEWHPYIQMEHADGNRDPEYLRNRGDAYDVYGQYGEFSAIYPNDWKSRGTNSLWWNGQDSGLSISDISQPAQTISFLLAGNGDSGDNGDNGNGEPTTQTNVYTNTITEGARNAEPNNQAFAYRGGTITAKLVGPRGTDFDLRLARWDGSNWREVAISENEGSNEQITYQADEAYYYFEVYAYSGSGQYNLTVTLDK
ncbi:M6 family metalloprotease domain-containing protein [Vibrio rhizosphaerae]|uniref:M6 family metalloprotease domain-containing protein n=1 Tax=Vibrio rhizosphaerae TaxID=398736 RepID=A0ABU4IWZ7_9VIBR|nr:M6 family metalloprotease domain-containing protein [Vibrio rhizosphaerae]MDW6093932.1 M6 family metalloprotease domain-containing protein [Vibrio rhizosphaerae]